MSNPSPSFRFGPILARLTSCSLRIALGAVILAVAVFGSARAVAEPKPTIIVLELKSQGRSVTQEITQTVGSLLPSYVGQDSRFVVQSGSELREMISLQAEKELVGCEENSCLAELAQALGARFVLFGNMGKLGQLIIINLALFDNVTGQAVARKALQAKRLEDLPPILEGGVRDLLAGVAVGSGDVPPIPAANVDAPPSARPKLPKEEFNDSVLVFNAAGNPFADSIFDFLFPEVVAYQGQSSIPLSPSEFYTVVGRQELASAYSVANATRYLLLFGGSGAFAIGGVMALGTIIAFEGDPDKDTLNLGGLSSIAYFGGLFTGITLLVVGALAVSFGIGQNPHPVTLADRKRMTDEYNLELRRRLNVEAPQNRAFAMVQRTLNPLGVDVE